MNICADIELVKYNYLQQVIKKGAVISKIIKETLLEVCAIYKVVIITNTTNPNSLHHLYDGAVTKPHTITAKTQHSGLLGGYIISDKYNGLKATILDYESRQKYYLIYTDNDINIVFENDILDSDNFVYVLGNEDGRIVTSDLDILMIMAPEHFDRTIMPESYGFGSVLKYELEIILEINKIFEYKVREAVNKSGVGVHQALYGPLVQHGPFSRFYKSQANFIHFPLDIYKPGYISENIEISDSRYSQLINILIECKNQNLMVEIPQTWRNVCVV